MNAEIKADVTPSAGPVLMRAGGQSGRLPLLDDLQGHTSLERSVRSVGDVLDSVLFGQKLAFCTEVNTQCSEIHP